MDKPTVTTDLEVDNTITVTATSAEGFAGDVTLTVEATDAASAAIAGWTTTLTATTLTVPVDGSASTDLTLLIPGNDPNLAGTLKISAATATATVSSNVAVTANPVMVVLFTENNGSCVYPARGINNPFRLIANRQIAVTNGATTGTMTIHVDNIVGFTHQSTATAINPGEAYMGQPTNVGDETQFYCHNGNASTLTDSGSHPFVRVE